MWVGCSFFFSVVGRDWFLLVGCEGGGGGGARKKLKVELNDWEGGSG